MNADIGNEAGEVSFLGIFVLNFRCSAHTLTYPPEDEHGGMVVHVKEAQLVVPFPQNDEETV
jgi:hypothetical protein